MGDLIEHETEDIFRNQRTNTKLHNWKVWLKIYEMTLLERIKGFKTRTVKYVLAVNNQLTKSEKSFLEFDKDLASEIANSKKNQFIRLKIDRDCENILALYSPVAVDLRFVLSVYKINHELERIADIADGIADYVNDLDSEFPKNAVEDVRIKEMFINVNLCLKM